MLASLDWKYKSIDDKKTPPWSSIKNVCASGSHQPTCTFDSLVDVLAICLFSSTLSLTTLGSLVDTIVSCTVSKVPLAV